MPRQHGARACGAVRIPLILTFVAVLAIVLVSVPVGAEEGEATDAAMTPLVWIETVRAANEARAELAREESAWREDRDRLLALRDAIRAEARSLEEEAATTLGRVEPMEAAIDEVRRMTGHGSVDDIFVEAAARLIERLDSLRRASAPGAVEPIDAAPFVPDAANRGGGRNRERSRDLERVLEVLSRAERAARSVEVSVLPGLRGEEAVAVRVLRVSGAAAWWLSLDGEEGGVVMIEDGEVVFEQAARARDLDEIRRAVSIGAGTETPVPCRLPLAPLGPDRR